MSWRADLPDYLRPMRRRIAPPSADSRIRAASFGAPRPRVRIGNVFDDPAPAPAPATPTDETGLVMRHELSPAAATQLQKISDQIATARKYGPWIAAGVGIVAGAVAAAVWWNASAGKGRRRKARSRR